MMITDRHLAEGEDALVAAVADAVDGGVNAVQLRERDLAPPELLALALRLRVVTAGRAALLVNNSLEIAIAASADGLHLSEAAEKIDTAGRPLVVGRSVHSEAAAEAAWTECSDYLVVGPVYETSSHPRSTPVGVNMIRGICAKVALPVVGVGGITAVRVEEVIASGASGVAVISAILGARSPGQAARDLREAVDAAWEDRS
jgi:thiamine-phosphate pyrophosphorylase